MRYFQIVRGDVQTILDGRRRLWWSKYCKRDYGNMLRGMVIISLFFWFQLE